jgi:hypothetical protein
MSASQLEEKAEYEEMSLEDLLKMAKDIGKDSAAIDAAEVHLCRHCHHYHMRARRTSRHVGSMALSVSWARAECSWLAQTLSDQAQTKAAIVDLLLAPDALPQLAPAEAGPLEPAPAPKPAEEGVPPGVSGGDVGKVLLLVTGMPKDQATEIAQRKCVSILTGKGLTVEEVDGTLEGNP